MRRSYVKEVGRVLVSGEAFSLFDILNILAHPSHYTVPVVERKITEEEGTRKSYVRGAGHAQPPLCLCPPTTSPLPKLPPSIPPHAARHGPTPPKKGKRLTKTVLKAVMGRARPHIVGRPELLDVPQPLELRPTRAHQLSTLS